MATMITIRYRDVYKRQTQSLGIVLGLTLVSGQLLNAYAVAATAAADIPKWDFRCV